MNYLVVDIEATCDEGKRTFPDQEVIEIGGVLLDSEFNEMHRFHSFVRPTTCPVLSDYCKDLTGITQANVDQSFMFREVWPKFVGFATRIPNPVFCSWSRFDWNLLSKECERSNMWFAFQGRFDDERSNMWFAFQGRFDDLSKRFTKRYGRRKGHRGAMKIMGIKPEGSHHRGLDDALNIAKMCPVLFSGKEVVRGKSES